MPAAPTPPPTRSAPRWPRSVLALVVGGLAMAVLFIAYAAVQQSGPLGSGGQPRPGERGLGLALGLIPNLLLGFGLWNQRRRLAADQLLPWVAYTTACLVMWASAVLDLLFQALGPPLGLLVLGPALIAAAVTSQPAGPTQQRARIIVGALGAVMAVALILIFLPNGGDAGVRQINGYLIFGIFAYGVPGLLWAALGLVLRTPDRPTDG